MDQKPDWKIAKINNITGETLLRSSHGDEMVVAIPHTHKTKELGDAYIQGHTDSHHANKRRGPVNAQEEINKVVVKSTKILSALLVIIIIELIVLALKHNV